MVSLFLSDLKRMHSYFGGGAFVWIKLLFLRSTWAVFLIRLRTLNVPVVGILFRGIASILLVQIFKIELAGKCRIGEGLMLPHPHDLILGASEIGDNVILMNSITLGAKYPDPGFNINMRPRIGDNVMVGVGARVLGGVRVGKGSIVGANSVVIRDVPEGEIVAGVPARVIKNMKSSDVTEK